jgi:hypothetical protein
MSGDESDPSFDDGIPVQTAQTAQKRLAPMDPEHFTFEQLKNRWVKVRSNGFTYKGQLLGADEREIYLRARTRMWVLPLERITDVRPIDDDEMTAPRMKRKGPIPGDPNPTLDDQPAVDEGEGGDAAAGGDEPTP